MQMCKVYFVYAVYEAMESFSAESEDEVGFKAGERIHVINKSMDGWWKIRYVQLRTAWLKIKLSPLKL